MLTITEIMYSTDTRRNIVNSEHVICIMHKVKCERFVLSLPEFCWMTTSTYFDQRTNQNSKQFEADDE